MLKKTIVLLNVVTLFFVIYCYYFTLNAFNLLLIAYAAIFLSSILFVIYISLPRNAVWFTLAYLALLCCYPIVSIVFNFSQPSWRVLNIYMLICIGGLNLFQLAYILNIRKVKYKSYLICFKKLEQIIIIYMLGMIVATLILYFNVGLHATRDEYGNSGSLSLFAEYLILAMSILYALLPVYLSQRKQYIVIALVAVILMAYIDFVTTKTRSDIMMQAVAFLIGYFYLRKIVIFKGQVAGQLGVMQHIKTLAIFSGLALLGIILRFVRGQMEIGKYSLQIGQFIKYSFGDQGAGFGDFGYSPIIYKLIDYVPQVKDYLYGQSYYRLFFAVIPRVFWPDKPLNTQRIVGAWFYPNVSQMTLPPGIIGDLYINFGLMSFLLMSVYGIVFYLLDRRPSLKGWLFFSTSLIPIFHLVRGGFTNPVIELVVIYFSAAFVSNQILKRTI